MTVKTMKTLTEPVKRGWRPRLDSERCADCGAGPGTMCRVAFNGKVWVPELALDWAHTQKVQ